jgi:hypothetical protein
MIPVTVQGQQQMEGLQVAGLAAPQAVKGKKNRRGDGEMDMQTGAHEAARAGLGMPPLHEDDDQGEGEARKGYAGAHEGPRTPMAPRRIAAHDFQRGPLDAGHAASSPQHRAPNPMPALAPAMPVPAHVDLTSSRAVAHLLGPTPPGGTR